MVGEGAQHVGIAGARVELGEMVSPAAVRIVIEFPFWGASGLMAVIEPVEPVTSSRTSFDWSSVTTIELSMWAVAPLGNARSAAMSASMCSGGPIVALALTTVGSSPKM